LQTVRANARCGAGIRTVISQSGDAMHEQETRLCELIEPTVSSLGFELVGVLWRDRQPRSLIRVYIDRGEGVTVDDCARVSHRVNGLLDVADPMPREYDLEVSSPGVDRPLFVERDFVRFAGAGLKVTLRNPFAGQRRFTGTLGGYRDGVVLVDEHGMEHRFAISEIESARLVPQW
jgi:ribosome maturation factor RimP